MLSKLFWLSIEFIEAKQMFLKKYYFLKRNIFKITLIHKDEYEMHLRKILAIVCTWIKKATVGH